MLFNACVSVGENICNKQIIDFGSVINKSVQVGLVSVVAYSIYNDLIFGTDPLLAGVDSPTKRNLAISLMICFFVWAIYFMDDVTTCLSPSVDHRLNTIKATI